LTAHGRNPVETFREFQNKPRQSGVIHQSIQVDNVLASKMGFEIHSKLGFESWLGSRLSAATDRSIACIGSGLVNGLRPAEFLAWACHWAATSRHLEVSESACS
jgi:hypothetical protein